MSTQETAIRYQEEYIPELANAATKQAYWQALAAGSSVLERANDSLVEVSPEGSRKIIKPLPAQTPTYPGQQLKIA
ncbi:MAG: hypothetical protein Q8O24_01065 [Gallionellaceae bacterium]|nr:hypothetical protein [Gallionellaceae bacterium]